MRFLPRLLVVLLCCLPVLGQNIRWDQQASTTTGKGQEIPVLALPGVVVNFYTGCTVLPCGTKAVTYTAAAGSTQCASGQQVVWQLPLPQACTSTADSQGNFGAYFQPGAYQYTITIGTVTYGPYQFNVGGGGSSGVSQIIAGSNVSITPTSGLGVVTINATGGGGGGGVNAGTPLRVPYYVDTLHVGSDINFSLSTPTDATTDALSFIGGGGANINTSGFGGVISLTALNTAQNNTPAQINLSTSLSTPNSSSNPGQIKISTVDTDDSGGTGLANAANIAISAAENSAGSTNNSGNVSISATDTSFGNGSGNVNISASSTQGSNGGNVSVTATGSGGGNVLLNADPTGGAVWVTGREFRSDALNLSVDETGDLVSNGSIRAASVLGSATLAPLNNVCTDASSNLTTTGCTGGGGGSGITGLTAGFLPLAGSSTTLTANSHLDEVTNAGFDTFSQGVIVGDGTGVGGTFASTEGTAPAAGSGIDNLYGDSSSHRLKENPNNAGAVILNGIATPGAAGAPVKLAANGIDIVDATPGTPTHTADAGAGTAGSLVVTFLTGANDNAGYVSLTTGNSPAANSGVITINYGGTYSAARKCVVTPSSALAQALGANGLFVPGSTSTTLKFDLTVGAVALPANTTGYQWSWSCQN